MSNLFFYKTTLSIVAFCWTLFSAAQDKTTVRATVDRSKILIGEPIQLLLEADIPEHEPIRFFQLWLANWNADFFDCYEYRRSDHDSS